MSDTSPPKKSAFTKELVQLLISLLANVGAAALTFISPLLALCLVFLLTISITTLNREKIFKLLKLLKSKNARLLLINALSLIITVINIVVISTLVINSLSLNHPMQAATATITSLSPTATLSTPRKVSYPKDIPQNISATCQVNDESIQGEITTATIHNPQMLGISSIFTTTKAHEMNKLSFRMSLENKEIQKSHESFSYSTPPFRANEPMGLSFSFVPLDTTPRTAYELTWKVITTNPGESWACIFPQKTITL